MPSTRRSTTAKTTASKTSLSTSLQVRKRQKAANKLHQPTLDEKFGSSSELRVKKSAEKNTPLLIGGSSDQASGSLITPGTSPSKGSQSSGELRVGKSDAALPKFGNKTKTATNDVETKQRDMDILRQFDLNYTFGPCAGISRMQRWKRAERHKQEPPTSVKELVEAHPDDPAYTEGIWHDTVI